MEPWQIIQRYIREKPPPPTDPQEFVFPGPISAFSEALKKVHKTWKDLAGSKGSRATQKAMSDSIRTVGIKPDKFVQDIIVTQKMAERLYKDAKKKLRK